MGTTVDKLNKILETKEAIRTAINNKGGTLTETDTFASYPTAIDSLPSGGSGEDRLKKLLDTTKSASRLFYEYKGTSVDDLISYNDTENVTDMSYMFYYAGSLVSIPKLNTKKVKNMEYFAGCCFQLSSIGEIDASNITSLKCAFYQVKGDNLSINIYNTGNVTNMYRMCAMCYGLVSLSVLDMNKVTDASDVFNNCSKLTYLKLLNVRISLQIGSGTRYGHLIEKDCLIQIISELIKPSSGTKTLTMGSANTAKLADTYVKLLDDDGSGKYPFVVCESTDEGAMTITDYCTYKSWQLA